MSNSGEKILVRCHSGCSQEQVIEALKERDLWAQPRRKASWEPVSPVPDTVPRPKNVRHYTHGIPVKHWMYKDSEGKLVGYIFRFDEEKNGKVNKVTLPYSWCKSDAGEHSWQWKSFAKPRPLYNLHKLASRPKDPVILFEGEKTSDAAEKLFPNYVCVCWPGGTKGVKYADLKPLAGRDVVLWPDADDVGRTAMNQAGEILFTEGATRIRLVDVPEWVDSYTDDQGKTVGKGWDVADELLPNMTSVHDMLAQARAFSPEGGDVVGQMNKRYAFILVGGKGAVLRETKNEAEDRVDVSYLSVEGFNQFYANSKVPVGRGFMPAGKFWMTHEDRRTYEGITFSPGKNVPGYYNLWRGFSVSPDPKGDWSIFKEHLLMNAAQGNPEHFLWIFGWFAQIFQQPAVKTSTSLSFRGKQGTGKTIIGKIFGKLLKNHYTLVEDMRYLFGQFNSHTASTILLHSDESFWGGDPRNVGKLKAMVSGDTHRIEYKTRDPIEVPNYMRLLITTNEDWVVPAAAEERRFAVFDMGREREQDIDYFVEMQRQLRDGGFAGLLHDLLAFNLSDTDIQRIPRTAALTEQKQTSMSDVGKFWIYCLTEGEILPGQAMGWPQEIMTHRLYETLIEHLTKWGSKYRPTPNEFMRELKTLTPPGSLADSRRVMSGKKYWCSVLPDLNEAREFLDKQFNAKFEWKVEVPEPQKVDEMPF